jgi:hypothetical protein
MIAGVSGVKAFKYLAFCCTNFVLQEFTPSFVVLFVLLLLLKLISLRLPALFSLKHSFEEFYVFISTASSSSSMKLSNLSLLIGLDLVTSVISQVSVSGGGTVLLPQPSIAASSTAKGAPFTNSSSTAIPSSTAHSAPYWLEQIPHLGVAPLSSNGSYQVFRNVKDFGAKGNYHHSSRYGLC